MDNDIPFYEKQGLPQTAHLFQPLSELLLELVSGLSLEQWDAPTCYPHWRVRHIAAHLLQGSLNRLSLQRDGWIPPKKLKGEPPSGFDELSELIGRSNETWTRALDGVSPKALLLMLRPVEDAVNRFYQDLARRGEERAIFAVSWAGEEVSTNRFDLAREFTERWHHQQQIREAVGAESLVKEPWISAVLLTLLRSLPPAWNRFFPIPPWPDVSVALHIPGMMPELWNLGFDRISSAWTITPGGVGEKQRGARHDTKITLSADIAWKVLTRSLDPESVRNVITIQGDETVAEPLFSASAVMVNAY